MKYYAVAEINITDPGWIHEYVEHTTRLVEKHGGRYLARTPHLEKIEGDRPPSQISLIIEWPSKEAAMAFYDSEAYKPHRESRRTARPASSCSSPARTSTASPGCEQAAHSPHRQSKKRSKLDQTQHRHRLPARGRLRVPRAARAWSGARGKGPSCQSYLSPTAWSSRSTDRSRLCG
jgi:uncharacterized protein (DUF1330 family)